MSEGDKDTRNSNIHSDFFNEPKFSLSSPHSNLEVDMFTDKGMYTAYTEIKPPWKKSTEIYAGGN